MSEGGVTIVYAYDPVDELQGRTGVLPAPRALADQLVAEHRVERLGSHIGSPMRFTPGTPAFQAAREALRKARGERPLAVAADTVAANSPPPAPKTAAKRRR